MLGDAAAPAVQADRQGDAERDADQRGQHAELEGLEQRGLQGVVVPHRALRVAVVPAHREALPARARAAVVERERRRDEHRQQRPQQVADRHGRQQPRLAPRVAPPRGRAALIPHAGSVVAGHRAHVVEHRQQRDDQHQQHERARLPGLPRREHGVVDQVADHRGAGRARQQVAGEVVAQHRQAGQQHAGHDHRPRHRPGHPPERREPVGAEVAGALDEVGGQPVEAGVQRDDHVGHVAVDQAEDHHHRLAPTATRCRRAARRRAR